MVSKKQFQKIVLDYYKEKGRHDLPWRKTHDPYKILVSEIMLQQTQVDRVIPKYNIFIKKFPSIRVLAQASRAEILTLWSGLGYNRRALYLKSCAESIVTKHNGVFPKNRRELESLPGIGPYTAVAILVFAYNISDVCIETNIRTVFLHHFFRKNTTIIHDSEIFPLIKKTLDHDNPRDWYYALMDYGVYLKQKMGNLNKKSFSYAKQKDFKTSDRFIRGKILKLLTEKEQSRKDIYQVCVSELFNKEKIDLIIIKLYQEKLINIINNKIMLPK